MNNLGRRRKGRQQVNLTSTEGLPHLRCILLLQRIISLLFSGTTSDEPPVPVYRGEGDPSPDRVSQPRLQQPGDARRDEAAHQQDRRRISKVYQ